MIEVHHELAGPGDAPVVVLSNSLATTLAMWDGNLPALVGRYRVVRYDMRGHGRSPVPDGPSTLADLGGDLLALLDRLGIERAHLVGVSIGGMVSLWTAANAPERVASLAPCFTSAQLGPPELWQERAATALAEGTEALADTTMARWFTAGFAAREPEVVAAFRAGMAGTSAAGYASLCHAIETMALLDELPRIAAPTLVVSGAHDPSTPPEHGRLIAERIPGARYAELDSAHIGNVERRDAFDALLLAHLG